MQKVSVANDWLPLAPVLRGEGAGGEGRAQVWSTLSPRCLTRSKQNTLRIKESIVCRKGATNFGAPLTPQPPLPETGRGGANRSLRSPTTNYQLPINNRLLPIAYCLPLTAYRLPLTAYRLPPTAYCLLLTAYCLLLTAYCLLLTAYCLLPTAYCLHHIETLFPWMGSRKLFVHGDNRSQRRTKPSSGSSTSPISWKPHLARTFCDAMLSSNV